MNPTALLNKTEQVLELGADINMISETSTTIVAQKTIEKSFRNVGMKNFVELTSGKENSNIGQ